MSKGTTIQLRLILTKRMFQKITLPTQESKMKQNQILVVEPLVRFISVNITGEKKI